MESQKSEWNFMMSELARAKQYAKFKGLRGSRLSSWMQAQEDLKMMASDKGVLPDDEGWEEGLLRIDVFRPASAKSLQYVIYKSGSDMVEYNIGIILSIYRGSVSKAQATDRRMTISKPLPVATPSNLVARVRVLQLDKLDGKIMVASGISKQSVVHVEDICGEIGEGDRCQGRSHLHDNQRSVLANLSGAPSRRSHLWKGRQESQAKKERIRFRV